MSHDLAGAAIPREDGCPSESHPRFGISRAAGKWKGKAAPVTACCSAAVLTSTLFPIPSTSFRQGYLFHLSGLVFAVVVVLQSIDSTMSDPAAEPGAPAQPAPDHKPLSKDVAALRDHLPRQLTTATSQADHLILRLNK